MKKRLKLGIVVICVFLCCGCNGTITRALRHDGFSIGSKFVCEKIVPTKKDSIGEKIKYFTDTHMISESGKIYEISLGQAYANKENCKEASTDVYVKSMLDGNIIKGTDSKFYYLKAQNNIEMYSEVPETDNSYELYRLLLEDDDVMKVITANNSTGEYYVLKNDGNIYSYTLSKENHESPLRVTSVILVYGGSQYGSKIVDFHYVGEQSGTFLKTMDKTYRMRPTNLSECTKYADIACTYTMLEDEVLFEHQDSVIAFNGTTLLTSYGQLFTISN